MDILEYIVVEPCTIYCGSVSVVDSSDRLYGPLWCELLLCYDIDTRVAVQG